MTVIVRARSTGGHEPSAGAAAREGKRGIVRVRVRPGESRCDEEGGVEKVGGDRGPRVEEERHRHDAWRFGLTYNRPNKARWPPGIAGRGRGVEGDMGNMRTGGRRRLT